MSTLTRGSEAAPTCHAPSIASRRPPSRGPAVLAVTVTSLVASAAYLGAVTPFALVAFVIPGVLLGSATAWVLGRAAGRVTTLVASVGLVLAWAQLVNVASGDANGPAARSTAVAGSFAALAALLSLTRSPVWFLAPVVGILVGAVMLGAAGEVAPIAVATAAIASVAMALSDRTGHATVGRRRDGMWLVLGLVVVALAAGLAVVLQESRAPEAAFSPLPELADPSVRPPWEPLGTPSPTATPSRSSPSPTSSRSSSPSESTRVPSPSPTPSAPEGPSIDDVVSRLVAGFWWLVWLAAVALILVRAWVAAAWWRFRRRCRAGDPAWQVVGAWTYLRARLRSLGRAMDPSLSPDDLVASPDEVSVPPGAAPVVPEGVRDLALLVVPAAFAADASPSAAEVEMAWSHADRAVRDCRREATWFRRITAGFSPPGRGIRRH